MIKAYKKIDTPLKTHGGKYYLAKKIVQLFPRHLHYVEPYAGGLSVLLAKNPEGVSEVVNDLNGELTNFWTILQHDVMFSHFEKHLRNVPFSEVEWRRAKYWREHPKIEERDNLFRAINFFIFCRQSLAGRMQSFATLTRNRTRRGMNEQASAWLSVIEGLPDVHTRLQRVVIFNRPALNVIIQQDGRDTLHYCDPPYIHETRNTITEYGKYEMSREDHQVMLDLLRQCKGRVVLSGYRNELYDEVLSDWNRHDFFIPNHASGSKKKKRMTESCWCNF